MSDELRSLRAEQADAFFKSNETLRDTYEIAFREYLLGSGYSPNRFVRKCKYYFEVHGLDELADEATEDITDKPNLQDLLRKREKVIVAIAKRLAQATEKKRELRSKQADEYFCSSSYVDTLYHVAYRRHLLLSEFTPQEFVDLCKENFISNGQLSRFMDEMSDGMRSHDDSGLRRLLGEREKIINDIARNLAVADRD